MGSIADFANVNFPDTHPDGTPFSPALSSMRGLALVIEGEMPTGANIGALVDRLTADEAALATFAAEYPGAVMTSGSVIFRPGDTPALYSNSLAGGAPSAVPVVATGSVVGSDGGAAMRVSGSAVTAARQLYPIEPDRRYLVRFVFQRRADTPDPDGDAVRCALAWYDGYKAPLTVDGGISVVSDVRTVTVAAGRIEVEALVSVTASARNDVTAPPGTRYARPYVQTFGADHLTDVQVIGWDDVTDAGLLDPVSADAIARIEALESENLPARVAALEVLAGGPLTETYASRSDFAAAHVKTTTVMVRLLGYYQAGDGGAADFIRCIAGPPAAPQAWHQESADGGWWQMVYLGQSRPRQFGARADGASDDVAALAAAVGFARSAAPTGSGYAITDGEGLTYAWSAPITLSSNSKFQNFGAKALPSSAWSDMNGMLVVPVGVASIRIEKFAMDCAFQAHNGIINLGAKVDIGINDHTISSFTRAGIRNAGSNSVFQSVINQTGNGTDAATAAQRTGYCFESFSYVDAVGVTRIGVDNNFVRVNWNRCKAPLKLADGCNTHTFTAWHFWNNNGNSDNLSECLLADIGDVGGLLMVGGYYDTGVFRFNCTTHGPDAEFSGGVGVYASAANTLPCWFEVITSMPNTDLSYFKLDPGFRWKGFGIPIVGLEVTGAGSWAINPQFAAIASRTAAPVAAGATQVPLASVAGIAVGDVVNGYGTSPTTKVTVTAIAGNAVTLAGANGAPITGAIPQNTALSFSGPFTAIRDVAVTFDPFTLVNTGGAPEVMALQSSYAGLSLISFRDTTTGDPVHSPEFGSAGDDAVIRTLGGVRAQFKADGSWSNGNLTVLDARALLYARSFTMAGLYALSAAAAPPDGALAYCSDGRGMLNTGQLEPAGSGTGVHVRFRASDGKWVPLGSGSQVYT